MEDPDADVEQLGTPEGGVDPLPEVNLGGEDPEYLFAAGVLHTLELRLNEEDLAYLDMDPQAERYVPGELIFEGKRVTPVGIRYKGSFGSFVGCLSGSFFPPSGSKACPKLSMKVKVDYSDPGAKFYGQKKLIFQAMNRDRSLMRERLGYTLYREMDVYASRTTHVRLLINGRLSGLYLLLEEVDDRFTRARFADGGGGNLYKEIWPVRQDPASYLSALETNRGGEPDIDKILAFAHALAEADDQRLPDVVAAWMDTEYVARFVAVDRTILHNDGPFHWYCRPATSTGMDWYRQHTIAGLDCGNHNYFWYEDTQADRVWPVPWDLDDAFVDREGFTSIRSAWDDLSYDCTTALVGLGGSPPQLPITCDPLQRAWALSLRPAIRDAMRELLQGPLAPSIVDEELALWADSIAPTVQEASAMYPREPSMETWLAEMDALKATLSRLRAAAGASVEAPSSGDAGAVEPDAAYATPGG